MKRIYKHLFFDLDHTLWDFDANAREALEELYQSYKLEALGINSQEEFIEIYTANNHKLWKDYHNGLITKDTLRKTRFRKTFLQLGLPEDNIPVGFEDAYVKLCPTKTNLFPYVHETLSYLYEKGYKLYIITNGFIQSSELKIQNTGIHKYFSEVFISEFLGVSKPHEDIFHYAMKTAKTNIDESLMIGDSLEADITGAINIKMDCVFFNPKKVTHHYLPTYEITELIELKKIL